ncbi:hypothetical protein ASZ90_018016 [hydrocarbon metagenome]|uniref:Uncharacterized protein n=1 Tax=hydrocarbon metagenome TaxID=938273 RepID=A0A0W8E7U6_9ZZZZ
MGAYHIPLALVHLSPASATAIFGIFPGNIRQIVGVTCRDTTSIM